MKVFKFDPTTGKRGEQIAEMQVPTLLQNLDQASCVLPTAKSSKPGHEATWEVCTKLFDREMRPITFPEPVCFCIGKLTAGTDTAWHWYAYLPK
jgi:hypothetical protein